jgi:hypothetical protein
MRKTDSGLRQLPYLLEHLKEGKDYHPTVNGMSSTTLWTTLTLRLISWRRVVTCFTRPYGWKRSRKIFEVMNEAYWHEFQIGTKRIERMEIMSQASGLER